MVCFPQSPFELATCFLKLSPKFHLPSGRCDFKISDLFEKKFFLIFKHMVLHCPYFLGKKEKKNRCSTLREVIVKEWSQKDSGLLKIIALTSIQGTLHRLVNRKCLLASIVFPVHRPFFSLLLHAHSPSHARLHTHTRMPGTPL